MGPHRGQDISGWVVVDKPAGPSSTQVTGRIRRLFDAAKAGHAGTLDPAATGVLAVALGEATKTMPFVADGRKAYRFTVRWGASTTTDDAEGTVTQTAEARPDAAAIRAALPAFTGDILQVPPAFSAVHVDGRRAYEIARTGARSRSRPGRSTSPGSSSSPARTPTARCWRWPAPRAATSARSRATSAARSAASAMSRRCAASRPAPSPRPTLCR